MLATASVLQTGCLRRRLIVRSQPPGAAVQIDNQPIGVTPASTDYVYYGTREVKLSLPGYETLTVNQPLPTPWYALPGVDFFTENLWPFPIDDRRELNFNLQRQRMAPAGEIVARGEQLRRQAAPQGVAPIGAAAALQGTPPPPATGLPATGFPSAAPALPPVGTTPLFPAPGASAPAGSQPSSLSLPRPTFAPPSTPVPAVTPLTQEAGPNPTPAPAQPFRY
ncbi:MAG: PEGA domain-containing protein [Planctomycetota bacterium]